VDQNVFKALVQERLPTLAQAFNHYSVAVSAITAQWFLCLFVSVTPAEVRWLACRLLSLGATVLTLRCSGSSVDHFSYLGLDHV